MKRFLIILVVGLLWGNVGFAKSKCIEGDCKNGQGTYVGKHGKYVGEWKDGKAHGQGTFTWTNGDKYVGEYKDDKRHGQGTQTWASGSKYVGGYKDGKRHGQGTFTGTNGEIYAGEWKKNKRHGHGTYTYVDGRVVVGIFKKDRLVKKISEDTSAKEKIELTSMIEDAKKTCKDLGFTEGTDKFSDCSLKLYTQSVELAAKQNQVVQGAMSGGAVTIYDPVRDNRALINQGMKMLGSGCSFGNC